MLLKSAQRAIGPISRGQSECANWVGFGIFPGVFEVFCPLRQNFVAVGGGVYTF